jgi:hypothetical protein
MAESAVAELASGAAVVSGNGFMSSFFHRFPVNVRIIVSPQGQFV